MIRLPLFTRALPTPLLYLCLLFGLSGSAWAVQVDPLVAPSRMVALTGAVPFGVPNTTTTLVRVGASGDFIVPEGQVLMLTDLIFAPQSVPSSGAFVIQVLPSSTHFSTALTSLYASAEDPSSFQVHLNSAMVFPAGSRVRVSLVFGSTSLNISAFGYLVKDR